MRYHLSRILLVTLTVATVCVMWVGILGLTASRSDSISFGEHIGGRGGNAIALSNGVVALGVPYRIVFIDAQGQNFGEILGEISVDDMPNNLEFNGDNLIASIASRGLAVIDISDIRAPKQVGELALPDARDFAIDNENIYVAGGGEGIFVVNQSNGGMILRQRVNTEQAAEYIDTDGGDLIVSSGWGGSVGWYDIQDLERIKLIDEINTNGTEFGVVIHNKRVYVAGGTGGIRVLDISRGDRFVELDSVASVGAWLVSLETFENKLYATDWFNGLQVLDVDESGVPLQVARLDGYSHISDVAVGDEGVYVGRYRSNEVLEVEINESNEVVVNNEFRLHETSAWGWNAIGIYNDANRVYVLSDDGVIVINGDDVSGLNPIGVIDISTSPSFMVVKESMYAAFGEEVVHYNISDLSNPIRVSSIRIPGHSITVVTMIDNRIVAITGTGHIVVFELDMGGGMRELGRKQLVVGTADSMVRMGDHVLVGVNGSSRGGGDQDGVFLVDISDPGNIATLDYRELGTRVQDIGLLDRDFIAVATLKGVSVLQMSRAKIGVLSDLVSYGGVNQISPVRDGLLAVNNNQGKVIRFHVSDSGSLHETSTLPIKGAGSSVVEEMVVMDDIALLASGDMGLATIRTSSRWVDLLLPWITR